MYNEDENEDERPEWKEDYFEQPSFESPSELNDLHRKFNELADISLKLAQSTFNQARVAAILEAKIAMLTVEIDSLKKRLDPK